MGCFRRVKKMAAKAARAVGPILMRHAAQSVFAVERMADEDPHWWTSEAKRKTVQAMLRQKRDELELDVPTHLINLAIEWAVNAVVEEGQPVEEIGEQAGFDELEAEANAA